MNTTVLKNGNMLRRAGAVLSGLLLTAAFPGIGCDAAAWFALVPLMLAAKNVSAFTGFRLGFLMGFVHYSTLLYWFIPFLGTYGPFPFYVSSGILVLFAAYLALYPALFAAGAGLFSRRPAGALFLIPAAWVAVELLRSTLLTGFPWELIGHTQFKRLRIIQISDMMGVYGVSYVIVLSNTILFQLTDFWLHEKNRRLRRTVVRAMPAGLFALVTAAGVYGYGDRRMQQMESQVASAPTRRIAVVQGNIDQGAKWDKDFKSATIQRYLRLSSRAAGSRPELIVWPETAMPFYFLHNLPLTRSVMNGLADISSDFVIGSPSFARRGEDVRYYNRAFLISGGKEVTAVYDKAHLVPFGEYVPLKKWLPFLGKMVAQVGDFSAGEKGGTLFWRQCEIGVLICYEQIFPYLSRAAVNNGADVLVNMTNDAWYGRSAAPYQHFSMAVFRAVENRRFLVRAANTGISAFVGPSGRILAQTPIFVEKTMDFPVALLDDSTVYTRWGDWFAGLCLLLFAAAAAWHGGSVALHRRRSD